MLSLNAPFGARCFLTDNDTLLFIDEIHISLNAPFGARCFLTFHFFSPDGGGALAVLMHLMALGAF